VDLMNKCYRWSKHIKTQGRMAHEGVVFVSCYNFVSSLTFYRDSGRSRTSCVETVINNSIAGSGRCPCSK